ncbi:hypothetical protein CI105_06745 [Candidatus Izimaplasma bacterium ZiA1]|uniref:pseudouridine synthase n=1 Tax=Candidatus Izimoplasma sp. ZiA1 TaxID=2024899 RepID=UPI000BAA4683|nr:hypothetical protein CI105_06745 [Candidatus Izimaplasma bacterium ZiA1]
MRIDKYLSNLKYGSRKEIKKFIKDKRVRINDEFIKKESTLINPNTDRIYFDDELVYYKENIILMMNKPPEYICANKDGLSATVMELIKEPYNRFDLNVAGRLDKDTVGLIILTNSGKILHDIITPKKDVFKKYYVKTKLPLKNLEKLLGDYTILDGKSMPFKPLTPIVEQIDDTSLYLSIKEGKFHQVKRMIKYIDNEVIYLKRVSIGDIILDENLEEGQYKEIEY